MKNNCCLFKRPFQIQKKMAFFVLEILVIFVRTLSRDRDTIVKLTGFYISELAFFDDG